MKAMVVSDLTIVRTYIWQQAIICAFIALVLSIGMGSLYGIIPAVASTGAFLIIINLVALDENNSWEKYRLTLPMSRSQVVLGRYASSLLLTIAFTLVGIILFFIIALTLPAVNGIIAIDPSLLEEALAFPWQGIVATTVIPLVLMLVFMAILLPLALRFGLTKSVRFLPVALFLIVMGTAFALQAAFPSMPSFLGDFLAWVATTEGTLIASSLAIVLALGVYAASFVAAKNIYEGREF